MNFLSRVLESINQSVSSHDLTSLLEIWKHFETTLFSKLDPNKVSIFIGIYKYKVVISVCLFVCPIIAHEPFARFVSNFDWGTREIHGNVLSLAKIVIYDQALVNGWSNYEYPGQCCVF